MTPLLKKLNLKQQEVCISNHPEEFESELDAIRQVTPVKTSLHDIGEIEFVLVFVKTGQEIEAAATIVAQKLKGDGVVWFAYPKGTSKMYKSVINRDHGWEPLGKWGFEPVRQVAIDADWSALRFRKVDFIKTMNRRPEFAMTTQGKQKTKTTGR